jgi:hypothetical protein
MNHFENFLSISNSLISAHLFSLKKNRLDGVETDYLINILVFYFMNYVWKILWQQSFMSNKNQPKNCKFVVPLKNERKYEK